MSTEKLYKSCFWKHLLGAEEFRTASVARFPTAPLSARWAGVVQLGTVVEVQSSKRASSADELAYWLATVVEVQGYFVKLRYLGYESDCSDDFWMNITTMTGFVDGIDYTVHPVGWSTDNKRELYPPRDIENSQTDWKFYLDEKLHGCVTIPRVFQEVFRLATTSKFKPGMKLEAVDTHETSCLRVVFVMSVVGRRLQVVYTENENLVKSDDQKFWFHESSHMIHPVGWAKLHGQAIRSTQYHYDTCLEKILANSNSEDEAPLECFIPLRILDSQKESLDRQELEVGMKLEFLAPQYPDSMTVGTIRKILRNSYLMIEADDGSSDAESNRMCFHATSNHLYPAGYAQMAGMKVRKPPGYENRPFKWKEYLEETESLPAPAHIFVKNVPEHGFEVGHFVEATDSLASENICVARIERVVDRLLLIHFEGFPCDYDQWVDCESPDIYPVGWCHSVGYILSEPGVSSTSPRGVELQPSRRTQIQPVAGSPTI